MGPEKMEYLILWQNLQILSFTKKTYEKIVKWSRKWQPEKYKIVQSKKTSTYEKAVLKTVSTIYWEIPGIYSFFH